MSELSLVEKARIYEYNEALRHRRNVTHRPDLIERADAAVEDAEESLRSLGLDPGLAQHVRIERSEIAGDR